MKGKITLFIAAAALSATVLAAAVLGNTSSAINLWQSRPTLASKVGGVSTVRITARPSRIRSSDPGLDHELIREGGK